MFEDEAELWRYLEPVPWSPDDWRYLELFVESAGAWRYLEPVPVAVAGSPEDWIYLEVAGGSPTPRRLVLLPYTPALLSRPLV